MEEICPITYDKETRYPYFITCIGVTNKKLPSIDELESPREPRYLRKHPKAVRFYKVKHELDAARFFLQELMLYTSFDKKMYNDWHDDEKCIID